MTNSEINKTLYEKMSAEQEKYRGWLLSQHPEEVLKHTYEYTVREDILMSLKKGRQAIWTRSGKASGQGLAKR